MKVISPPRYTPMWKRFKFLSKSGYDLPDSYGLHHAYQNSFYMRKKTFSWPWTFPRIWQSVTDLSLSGFRYAGGESDHVLCVFCGVVIGAWEAGDCPYAVHKKVSPGCPQVKRFKEDLFITCDCSCDNLRERRMVALGGPIPEEEEEEEHKLEDMDMDTN